MIRKNFLSALFLLSLCSLLIFTSLTFSKVVDAKKSPVPAPISEHKIVTVVDKKETSNKSAESDTSENPSNNIFPVVIIGSGAAAQGAALFLNRANIAPLIIQGPKPLGTLVESQLVNNWPGLVNSGMDIMKSLEQQNKANGAYISLSQVTDVNVQDDFFSIDLLSFDNEEQSIKAKYVIIASGSKPKFYEPLKNKPYLWAQGVHSCSHCDGLLYKDKLVAVVGGGDSAVLEAINLAGIAKQVFMLIRGDKFRASDQKNINSLKKLKNVEILFDTEVEEIIHNSEKITDLKIIKAERGKLLNKKIKIDGLFLAIGYQPNTKYINSFIQEKIIEINTSGYIITNKEQETTIENLYAVGDVADPIYKQAITAFADGVKSAFSIINKIKSNQPYFVGKKSNPLTIPFEREFTRVINIETKEELDLFRKKFNQQNKSNQRKILFLSANWCNACRSISPELDRLSIKLKNKVVIAKLDVDMFPEFVVNEKRVGRIPTIFYLDKSTSKVKKIIGGSEIISFLNSLI